MQDEMMEEFQFLDGQEPTLREYVKVFIDCLFITTLHPFFSTLDRFRGDVLIQQGRHIIDIVQDHLVQINTLLRTITYQLERSPTAPSGIVINQQFCSSKVVLDLVAQLRLHAGEMENVIDALADPERREDYEKRKQRRKDSKKVNYLVIAGSIGLLVAAGFFLVKRIGMK